MRPLPRPSRVTAAASALTAAALTTAVVGVLSPASATRPADAPAATATATTADSAASATPRVTKLLTFVVENHSLAQMQARMPYTSRLARSYGYARRWTAARHPSLPNYLAIAGGSTFHVGDDRRPSRHRLHGRSVFGQALRRGKSATVYVDGMPTRCALHNGGRRYVARHNPWAYFAAPSERAGCRAHDVPLGAMQGDITRGRLPNAGMVVPNLCHDAHDCSLATADRWFRARMRAIMAGPDWTSGRLAVVLTADEDDHHSGNRVLTVVVHRSQQRHVVRTALNHYSLCRLYSQVLGTSHYLRRAGSAPNMATAFGLPLH